MHHLVYHMCHHISHQHQDQHDPHHYVMNDRQQDIMIDERIALGLFKTPGSQSHLILTIHLFLSPMLSQ